MGTYAVTVGAGGAGAAPNPEQQVQMVLTQYLVYPLQLLPLVVAVVVDLVRQ